MYRVCLQPNWTKHITNSFSWKLMQIFTLESDRNFLYTHNFQNVYGKSDKIFSFTQFIPEPEG